MLGPAKFICTIYLLRWMWLVPLYISLGAITAWTSCSNRAGVWMVLSTRVCVMILSELTLILWQVLVLLWTSVREVGVFVSVASFLKCNGTRQYVQRLPLSPLVRKVLFVLVCGAYIKCWRAGQLCSSCIWLWSDCWTQCNSKRRRLCISCPARAYSSFYRRHETREQVWGLETDLGWRTTRVCPTRPPNFNTILVFRYYCQWDSLLKQITKKWFEATINNIQIAIKRSRLYLWSEVA